MYEVFQKLLIIKGVTAYKVAKATGISTATLTQWKHGSSTPKADKMQKIADFFDVTVDYLMTGKEPNVGKALSINKQDERILKYAEKLIDLGITPEALGALIDVIEKVRE